MFNCALCKVQGCSIGDKEHLPTICPTREDDLQGIAKELYSREENRVLNEKASLVAQESEGKQSRIDETVEFMKKCGYKKIGLMFCISLSKEANIIEKIFEGNGFEVIGVMCKNGAIPKSDFGISEKVEGKLTKKDIMCNPIGQALYLNENKTEFNVILGLCVGHDTLAIKHSDAPVTVLAVKDRLHKHNPLAAIY